MSRDRIVTALVGALLLLPAFLFPQQILCIGADGHVELEWTSDRCCGEEGCAGAEGGTAGLCGGDCDACIDIPFDPPRIPLPESAMSAVSAAVSVPSPAEPLPFTAGPDLPPRPASTGPPLFLAHQVLLI